jgi:prepilin-type N-terminal cleavage/methylation domain-containing protein
MILNSFTKKRTKKKKNNLTVMLGFTLIEVLISIAIFGIISTLVIAGYKTGRYSAELNYGAEDLVNLVKKTRHMAFTGKVYKLDDRIKVPPGGYGIHVNKCKKNNCLINIFADLDGQLDYDKNLEDLNYKEYKLFNNLFVDDILIEPQGSNIDNIDIVFKPPLPLICVNSDCSNFSLVEIVLGHKKISQKKKIIIDLKSGQISAQNN